MADAGFAAQDVGEFGRRDRSHSAEKGGVVRRGHGHDRTPGHKCVGCRTFGVMGVQALGRGPCRLPHFASRRDPSTPNCQRTLIAEAKSLPLASRCCESWVRLVPRRPARPRRERLRQGSHPRPRRAADEDRADPGRPRARSATARRSAIGRAPRDSRRWPPEPRTPRRLQRAGSVDERRRMRFGQWRASVRRR